MSTSQSTDSYQRWAPLAASAVALVLGALVFVRGAAPAASDPSTATFICRVADTGENANAHMNGNAETALVCRNVALSLQMSNGALRQIGQVTATQTASGPDLSKALTPEQLNDAWVKFVEQTFHIVHS